MSQMKVIAVVLLAGLSVPSASWPGDESQSSAKQTARAQDVWEQELHAVCSKTQDAMTFSMDELKTLIQKCDTLQQQIDKLDETRKKVYAVRLRMCRGLYAYVLESKENEKK